MDLKVDVDSLRKVEAKPGDTFVLELTEDNYAQLSPSFVAVMSEEIRSVLGDVKILVMPPGAKFKRLPGPYYVRRQIRGCELEIGFATHAEMMAYLDADEAKEESPLPEANEGVRVSEEAEETGEYKLPPNKVISLAKLPNEFIRFNCPAVEIVAEDVDRPTVTLHAKQIKVMTHLPKELLASAPLSAAVRQRTENALKEECRKLDELLCSASNGGMSRNEVRRILMGVDESPSGVTDAPAFHCVRLTNTTNEPQAVTLGEGAMPPANLRVLLDGVAIPLDESCSSCSPWTRHVQNWSAFERPDGMLRRIGWFRPKSYDRDLSGCRVRIEHIGDGEAFYAICRMLGRGFEFVSDGPPTPLASGPEPGAGPHPQADEPHKIQWREFL
jgi:hypothetical protein